ncbi:unnamed protein product [Echinostoma caproni]|uniref:Aminotran_5 domain-containing protein n=1 Tax=Echinostoma caproni TaxID=27848 RepID=A0A183B3P0_9TREM|nr:unnamed protein product [Echinostoma caproni]
MLSNFGDTYMNIPAQNTHDALKETLLRHMTSSEEKRIQLFLCEIQLGNLKLSQLLQQMRALVCNTSKIVYVNAASIGNKWTELKMRSQGADVIAVSET